ncbi:MAG: ribosome-associated translation inhibitor RaiA [Desulfobacteraceae bacterium]|nr:ribosome-associated translation inhibitor RaiA [Desulfobacteraceae bacterium]MCB9494892.1 ribosome-associated translation inhibitor RaiA [Desulfobacteraceae bacterium]
MNTSVSFKNIEPSDALRDYVEKKLEKIEKRLDAPAEAEVVFTVEKIRHITEIRLRSDKLHINAKEESEDMYSSIDLVLEKVKRQIKSTKEKMQEKRPGNKDGIKGDALLPDEEPLTDAE